MAQATRHPLATLANTFTSTLRPRPASIHLDASARDGRARRTSSIHLACRALLRQHAVPAQGSDLGKLMFKSTQPQQASDFEPTGVITILTGELDLPSTAAGDLGPASAHVSPSLLLELKPFSEDPASADLLSLVAASARHGKPLSLALQLDDQPLSLTLDPQRQVYYSTRDLCVLSDDVLARVNLQRIEPSVDLNPPADSRLHTGSLRPLLWHLALRGAQSRLLPELAGPVRCRVALGTPLGGLPIDGATKRLIERMKGAPVSMEDLLTGTILGRAAIQRIWNALYLQSALMVTRAFRH